MTFYKDQLLDHKFFARGKICHNYTITKSRLALILNIFQKYFLLIYTLSIVLVRVHNFEVLHNFLDLLLKDVDKFLVLYSNFLFCDVQVQL